MNQDKKQIPQKRNFAYHPWLVGMECRKDILIENQVLNQKIRNSVTPLNIKLKESLRYNKFRIAYFFGFCFVFSLDRIYDAIVYGNKYYPKLQKIFKIAKPIHTVQEQRRYKLNVQDEKIKKLGKVFLQLDERIPITGKVINSLKNNEDYHQEYVDASSFINTFEGQNIQELITKVKGKYYGFNLTNL